MSFWTNLATFDEINSSTRAPREYNSCGGNLDYKIRKIPEKRKILKTEMQMNQIYKTYKERHILRELN